MIDLYDFTVKYRGGQWQSIDVKNVKKNVNVVYSGHALSFEIASLGMPLKHRKQKKNKNKNKFS